jgi:hypothetical protein
MSIIQDLLNHLTGRRTVPNIILDFESIGGSDEIMLLDAEGGLQKRFDAMDVIPEARRRKARLARQEAILAKQKVERARLAIDEQEKKKREEQAKLLAEEKKRLDEEKKIREEQERLEVEEKELQKMDEEDMVIVRGEDGKAIDLDIPATKDSLSKPDASQSTPTDDSESESESESILESERSSDSSPPLPQVDLLPPARPPVLAQPDDQITFVRGGPEALDDVRKPGADAALPVVPDRGPAGAAGVVDPVAGAAPKGRPEQAADRNVPVPALPVSPKGAKKAAKVNNDNAVAAAAPPGNAQGPPGAKAGSRQGKAKGAAKKQRPGRNNRQMLRDSVHIDHVKMPPKNGVYALVEAVKLKRPAQYV